jgi:glycosyltransferase involved in cell wall biosynthesis
MLLENNPYPQDGRVRREASSLTDAGYCVTVVCPAAIGQRKTEVVEGVRVYRYPAPKERDGLWGYLIEYGYSMVASGLLTFYAFVRSGFDVIHAHNPPDTFVLIAVFYKLLGKKFVFDHHDLAPEMYYARFGSRGRRLVHRALLLFEKMTFRTADHIISSNESYREIAMSRGGVPAAKISVVRNGPEGERVRTVDPDPVLRGRASTLIGYVGIMGYQDGVDHLIRALGWLVTEYGRDDVLCVLVGSGAAVPSLRALTRELGLDENVWFTGRIPDEELMRYLSTVDICVDPDPSNPFNDRSTMIKMTEYMALGKPIVAFDLPEHRFTADSAAVYATANDERDFARKIEDLIRDPDARRRMGEFGRERIDRKLAWRHQKGQLLAAYDELLASRL